MPYSKEPVHKWVHSTQKNFQYGKNNVGKEKTSATVTKNGVVADTKTPDESKKYAYDNNDKGKKNPMTRTQWRRYQRYKKIVADDNTIDPKGKHKVVEIAKRPEVITSSCRRKSC